MVAVADNSLENVSANNGADKAVAAAVDVIISWPKLIIALGIALIIGAGAFLPTMVTDTRPNAFLDANNPALVYREKVKQQFGLSDPLIVAVQNESEDGIYTPQTLNLVQWLSDEIFDLPNVDAASSFSLATEKSITGSSEGLDVEFLFEDQPGNAEAAQELRQVLENMPVYQGTLVARDGSVTLLVVELEDEFQVEQTYQSIMDVIARASLPESVSLHVAGEGAIAGFLAQYIDADAKRLNPLAWIIIMLILFVAYRRFSPLLMANVIIAASAVISLGVMAANDIPFFMITTALPVILIGISVADTIHVYSHYFDTQIRTPELANKPLVMQTMLAMWRPITLTSLTTMAGFMGLYFAALMPPFKYFGLFAALGVFVAWAYSMTVLPAALVLLKPQASPAFSAAREGAGGDLFSRLMLILQRVSLGYPRLILSVFVLISLAGAYAASQLTVDEEPITIFDPSEPIYQADTVINQHMDGANALDIVVQTDTAEGLFLPANMRKIEGLQNYTESLPHVGGAISIIDYLKQMNRALNNGDPEMYRLPDSAEAVAQYFLLYSISGDPSDFEEEVDYDYQTANIRVNIDSGSYQKFKPIVEQLQDYIDNEFNDDGIQANLSGRVNLNYHWISDLARSHYLGLMLALVLVWAMASLLFNSTLAGVYALIPVAGSVLLVYAAMVVGGLELGVGTSMFAAVAIGLGVDFAIHTLSHLRKIHREKDDHSGDLFAAFYQTTGKALLFNFLAIACGFGVLIISSVSSLNNFGAILVVAITSSFVASMTLLPAMVYLFQPAFISGALKGMSVNGSDCNSLHCDRQ